MKYLFIGLLGGVLGGMGMGGGTLLIPLLTLCLDVPQKSAQLINILAFIPMGILTLVLNHMKGLIRWKYMLYVSLSGAIGAIVSSFFVDSFDAGSLRIAFGGFLILLGLYFVIATIVEWIRKKRRESIVNINMPKADDDE